MIETFGYRGKPVAAGRISGVGPLGFAHASNSFVIALEAPLP